MKMLKVAENANHVVAEGENAKVSLEITAEKQVIGAIKKQVSDVVHKFIFIKMFMNMICNHIYNILLY